MIIAIDFDGTCVTHEFPNIGKEIPMAIKTLRDLVNNGHKLILYTMRSDRLENKSTNDPLIEDVTGMFLSDAVKWFKDNNIELYSIQRNPKQDWTTSPKCYAELYIDDAALGCPLSFNPELSEIPFADWVKIRSILTQNELIDEL